MVERLQQNLDADTEARLNLIKCERNRKANKKAKIKKLSCKTSEHNIFTHFPKCPNCRVCQLSKVQKAQCRAKTEHEGDSLPIPQKFGDAVTCDHKILNEDQEDRENDRNIFVILDRFTQFIQAYAAPTKSAVETMKAFQNFFEPGQKPLHTYSDNSKEIKLACDQLGYSHDTSTPHRSETNGIAERAVRRVKEGTAAVLTQSGFTEHWWNFAMNAFCFMRCIVDKLDDGQTAYYRRYGKDYDGPTVPFGALVEYTPKTAKDKSRIHPMGNQRLTGILVEYKQHAGGGWANQELGLIDCEELDKAETCKQLTVKFFTSKNS